MKETRLITRRRMLAFGLAAGGGLLLPRLPKDLPPTYGNPLRMGDILTYAAHRIVLPEQSLVREYGHQDITSFPATGTTNPGASVESELGETYRRLQAGAFADWRLSVEGAVASPRAFSLSDLKRMPSRTQITRHTCEEGWTAIGKWTGVQLSKVLEAVGASPSARFVLFQSYDGWSDSIDMLDALHQQTLLAYGMNDRDLPIVHGAPVRLRVERQIGYKHMKYVHRVVVLDDESAHHRASGDTGWSWYAGI